MHYELYVDSLFLVNFIMNLYLLILVDRNTLRMSAPGRLIAGAAVGALAFLLPFLWTAPGVIKLALGISAGTAGMLCVSFPVKSFRMFLKLLERLIWYTFGMGGGMLFLVRLFQPAREVVTGVLGILAIGALIYLFLLRVRFDAGAENSLCEATLSRDGKKVVLRALIDSGNSLYEPVSGKPVCVVDEEVFRALWGEEDSLFRAIPYHSIGKKSGIMRGFLLPGLQLEVDGMRFSFREVYIAVGDQRISGGEGADAESIKMIVNPELFAGRRKGKPRRRQNERYNDFKSDNTGQDAV